MQRAQLRAQIAPLSSPRRPREHDALRSPREREHRAAVHYNAHARTIHRRCRDEVTAGTEHSDAAVVTVSDDDLVHCGARNAFGTTQHPYTDVADELSVDAEHAHAVVKAVSDGNVTVVVDEAQSTRAIAAHRHRYRKSRSDEAGTRHAS